jgi:ABC-type lipoprotein release transport system permease subunit
MTAMRNTTLIRRSLWHYRGLNLGVMLGTAVACAVLTGALAVGDSVRGTLASIADVRLGRVVTAVLPGDRFFRAELAADVAESETSPATIAPAMFFRGAAVTGDETRRANRVQILGVDARFAALAPSGQGPAPAAGEAVLNQTLAQQLNVAVGDDVLLLAPRPSLLPREAVLARTDDATAVLRRTVSRIVAVEDFGRFGLNADQLSPMTAFVNLAELGQAVDQPGRANALFADRPLGGETLAAAVTLDDLNLQVHPPDDAARLELRSGRVFLAPPVAQVARRIERRKGGVLTYLVNDLRRGERSTPYSMVSALSADGFFSDIIPADLADDEIVINDWLARDLDATIGEEISLTYFVLGPRSRLAEASRTFRIRAIVPLAGPAGDPTLMPEFPGIAEEENCRDWEAGIPIDFDRIREKDEAYWDTHRGTPKAFVSLAAGEAMWANRFGELTAIRYDADNAEALAATLRSSLDVERLGFVARDVRRRAHQAVSESLDFGGLFLGLSLFLIIAAVLLTALLFVFGIQQRGGQIGTLRAMGWSRWGVARLLLGEGALLALAGCGLGCVAGLAYTKAMVALLAGVWSGAVADFPVQFHVAAASILLGAAGSFLAAMAAMGLALWRAMAHTPRQLQAGDFGRPTGPRGRRWPAWAAGVAAAGAIGLVLSMRRATGMAAAGVFFGAGTMLLSAGLFAMAWRLSRRRRDTRNLSYLGLMLSGPSRRPGRSLACAGLLAAGVFLTVSIRAFHIDPTAPDARRKGTGNFALYAESALPIYRDLDAPTVRKDLRLPADVMRDASVVPLRLRTGDDASCLNLNRAQQPRILGVDPQELARRDAFEFASQLSPSLNGWAALEAQPADAGDEPIIIPAVADEPTLTWALGKKLGDSIRLSDARGRRVKLQFVGAIESSILQGSVLIDEDAFTELFPDETGWQVFLIDVPPPNARTADVAEALTEALADAGLAATPAVERLEQFAEVQNTYLRIFSVLGALGLLLGSGGFGIVVLRNVFERRGELAVLRAVGYSRAAIRRLIVGEHLLLLVVGLAVGGVAAAVAILPAGRGDVTLASLLTLTATAAGVGILAAAWTALATRWALRGRLLPALRNE